MSKLEPGNKEPTTDDIGKMAFVLDYFGCFIGPGEILAMQYGTVFLKGYSSAHRRHVVLAEPAEPNPYRVDPNDLEPGEWIWVWIAGSAEHVRMRKFHNYDRHGCPTAFSPTGYALSWDHARRAKKEEII